MKHVVVLLLSGLLGGCQLTSLPAPIPSPVLNEPPVETVPEAIEPEQEVMLQLTLQDTPSNLGAWLDYKQLMLLDPMPERVRLRNLAEPDAVAQLQRVLLNLHPDMPYVTRFRVQTQFAEQVTALPPRLAALFSWDLTFNQKLLEAESAVSAVTRLNAQQQETIDRLQRTNRELQKKIDALTQIEAELNQQSLPDSSKGANNGQR